jgi:two-component system, CitB family, sensor kinase
VATKWRKLWRRPRLSTQILLLSLAIIVVGLGAGFTVSILEARDRLDRESGRQSLAIARTVSQIPEIVAAFGRPRPERVINPIAERVRVRTGAAFVVVANRQGIRYSHPNPDKIGEQISTDPSQPLSGKEYVGVQTGTLGRSVRAKVPVRDARGRIVGLVSVGLLERQVSAQLRTDLPVLLIPPALGLALGALGSLLLARRIKRQTFGLEPKEIARLLEQREAVLHGIREGTVATDTAGRITLLNDEAKRLLALDDSALGRPVVDVVPGGHVREVLAGSAAGPDQIVVVNHRVLVANRMPVTVRGRAVGAVVTLRDRTELEGLMRELNDVRSLADALRAQEHEFSHKLHVLGGLIELGRYDEAMRFVSQSSLVHQELVASIVESIGEPTLVALLLGKAAVASERGIELRVTEEGTRLPEDYPGARDLVTVVGNLVDNALDSVAPAGAGWVEVTIRDEGGGVLVRVHDSGPGVDPVLVDEIFRDGFTTKIATGTGRRGLGLALVSQTVRRRPGGYVTVVNEKGALFTAFLPHDEAVVAR